MPLPPGATHCYPRPGGGYCAEIVARAVGPATEVIALNSAPCSNHAGGAVDKRLEGGRQPNIRVVKAELDGMGLGRNTLKPGGILAIVHHHAAPGTGTSMIDSLHRIDAEFARRDFERHGFVLDAESDLLRNPADDHTLGVFDDAIRHHTDRFIHRFRKPPS